MTFEALLGIVFGRGPLLAGMAFPGALLGVVLAFGALLGVVLAFEALLGVLLGVAFRSCDTDPMLFSFSDCFGVLGVLGLLATT